MPHSHTSFAWSIPEYQTYRRSHTLDFSQIGGALCFFRSCLFFVFVGICVVMILYLVIFFKKIFVDSLYFALKKKAAFWWMLVHRRAASRGWRLHPGDVDSLLLSGQATK